MYFKTFKITLTSLDDILKIHSHLLL